MTKQHKVIGVVVAILVILGVVGTCARIHIANKEDELYKTLNSVKATLPSDVVVDNNMEKGFLATRGDYNISKDGNAIKIHYKIEHSFLSWFGGPMEFHSKTTIDYPNFKMMEPIRTDGTISQNGGFDLVSKSVEAVYLINNGQGQLVIAPTQSHLLYDGKTHDLEANTNIPTITLNNEIDQIKINNIEAVRKTNADSPLIGEFNVSFDSLTDQRQKLGTLSLGKFNLLTHSEVSNNKFKVKVDVIGNDLETPSAKNNKIELAYSLNDLNYDALNDIEKLTDEGNALHNIQTKHQIAHDINQIVESGFSIVIDKIYGEKPDGKINLSASYVLAPSKPANFSNNSQFKLNVASEGSWVQPMAESLSTFLSAPITTNGNTLNVKLSYDKGEFKANDLPMDSPLKDEIQKSLSRLDVMYKLMFDEQNGLFFKNFAQLEQQEPNASKEAMPNNNENQPSAASDTAPNLGSGNAQE